MQLRYISEVHVLVHTRQRDLSDAHNKIKHTHVERSNARKIFKIIDDARKIEKSYFNRNSPNIRGQLLKGDGNQKGSGISRKK